MKEVERGFGRPTRFSPDDLSTQRRSAELVSIKLFEVDMAFLSAVGSLKKTWGTPTKSQLLKSRIP